MTLSEGAFPDSNSDSRTRSTRRRSAIRAGTSCERKRSQKHAATRPGRYSPGFVISRSPVQIRPTAPFDLAKPLGNVPRHFRSLEFLLPVRQNPEPLDLQRTVRARGVDDDLFYASRSLFGDGTRTRSIRRESPSVFGHHFAGDSGGDHVRCMGAFLCFGRSLARSQVDRRSKQGDSIPIDRRAIDWGFPLPTDEARDGQHAG